MTTIGLIRHGITEWNVLGKTQGITDIPLNDEGRKQANAIARRLAGEEWDAVYSSDLTRAKQTAETVRSALVGITALITDERLREINCGQIEGTTEDERVARWGNNWRDQELGMEGYEEAAKRGVAFIEELAMKHRNQNILVVSHGALIGLSLQRLFPHLFTNTYIDNTSLTIVAKPQEAWECRLYNCTKHL
ncbi:histidine phosphatase family protein [Paenibacillus sp. MMS18-CY102]|uniref:histidine phosphatase family protein n=1 Tax=Paenibacillus sp. MMS18-CY102 TaxID=2682849 RepID=UPI0013665CFB|nr:histidine phosphatase family protein [Paenibacillus sp. MMS18-CY102]MWC26875.1 histidine phosphatase family protein [Paenibacillus sp. MMS18-CY102]